MYKCKTDGDGNSYLLDENGIRHYGSPPTNWQPDVDPRDEYSKCPICWTVNLNIDYKWWSSHWMEHANSKDKPQEIWSWLPFNIQIKNGSIIIKTNPI